MLFPLWHDFRLDVPLHSMIVLHISIFHFNIFIFLILASLWDSSNGYFTLNMCLFLIKIRYFPKHNKQHLYYSCQLTYDVNKQKLYIILLDTFPPLCNWLTGTSNECRICHKYVYLVLWSPNVLLANIFWQVSVFKYPIIHKYLDINL